jgi:hypothetical protein
MILTQNEVRLKEHGKLLGCPISYFMNDNFKDWKLGVRVMG